MAELVLLKAALNVGAAAGIGAFADFACQQIEIGLGGRRTVDKAAEQEGDDDDSHDDAEHKARRAMKGEGDEPSGLPIHVKHKDDGSWRKAVLCKGRVYLSDPDVAEEDEEEGEEGDPERFGSPVAKWKHAKQRYDCWRTCRFTLSFGVVGGTNSFIWYNYILPPLSKGHFWHMVAWDMIFYNTYFTMVGITMNEALRPRRPNTEGVMVDRDGNTTCEAACARFWPTYILAQSVLFPCDLIMFSVIPRQWRVVFVKSVDVVWMTGASYLANRPIVGEHTAPEKDPDASGPCPGASGETPASPP
eukprot:Hpha_TRINITY_DN16745_c2_g1::TRINITY_DN16745_c2_g1_i1::g.77610::m.77610